MLLLYSMIADTATRLLAQVGELEPLFAFFGVIFEQLFVWGSYILANPMQSLVLALVLIAVVVVAKFILKTVWRVFAYIILPLALLYAGYVFVLAPILNAS